MTRFLHHPKLRLVPSVRYTLPVTLGFMTLWPVTGSRHMAAVAQTPAVPASALAPVPAVTLPALAISPSVIGTGATITLQLPAGISLPNTRTRIGIFERERPTALDDEVRQWTVVGGRWQTTFRLEADPGEYEVRVLSNDKNRVSLSQMAVLTIPGIDREPGWWLANGSPFWKESRSREVNTTPPVSSSLNAPLFITGLKRNQNGKAKAAASANIALPNVMGLQWRTLDLGQVPVLKSGTQGMALDAAAFRTTLTTAMQQARTQGESNLVGVTVAAPDLITSDTAASAVFRQVRQIVGEVAPDAALIFRPSLPLYSRVYNALAVNQITACVDQCDAVLLPIYSELASPVAHAWSVKAARRIAEIQPLYDLPILLDFVPIGPGLEGPDVSYLRDGREPLASTNILDFWMSGATGVISGSPWEDEKVLTWSSLIRRNLPLFVGSVTLEDTGILPSLESFPSRELMRDISVEDTAKFYELLRSIGRIPLLARTQKSKDERGQESFLLRLGTKIDPKTVDDLRLLVSGGSRIYVEGSPLQDLNGKPSDAFASLVNATIKPIEHRNANMVLDDVWTFGTARGTKVPVGQNVTVELKTPLADKKLPKTEKGMDVVNQPRVSARLEDGTPAVVTIPVGLGQIVWAPHAVAINEKPEQAILQYYSGIASTIQPALVQVRNARPSSNASTTTASAAPAPSDAESELPVPGVRVALRLSSKGTLLVGVFNAEERPHNVAVSVQSAAKVALDLANEKELSLQTRGLTSTVNVMLPAYGWKLIAFGASRPELDDERNAPRLHARIR